MKVIARWSNYPRGWEFTLPQGQKVRAKRPSRTATENELRVYFTHLTGHKDFELEVIRDSESPNTPLD